MYEVLIAHLRECAKLDASNNTYTEAADAIEQLEGENERLHDDLKRALEILANEVQDAPTIIPAEEVYGQYTDTAGNFHWCGTHSGEHTIRAEEGE